MPFRLWRHGGQLFLLWMVLLLIFLHRKAVPFVSCLSSSASSHVSTKSSSSWPYEFHVAPMQGYTNAPLRHFLRLLSPDAVLWTEMEKVKDINNYNVIGNPVALEKRFGTPNHHHRQEKLTLQLGGNDPTALEKCIVSLAEAGYTFDEVNLNCGCPSIEAGGAADFGASLMKQPELTHELIEAIHNAACQQTNTDNYDDTTTPSTTVSLKCRTAVFETVQDMESSSSSSSCTLGSQRMSRHETLAACMKKTVEEQQFQSLCHYISRAQEGGILHHVALHARPAVLAGLSSSKNRIVPPLDYSIVTRIAAEFPNLRVTLNGGISSLHDLDMLVQQQQQQQTTTSSSLPGTVASHMAGRWTLQHPLALVAVQDKYLTRTKSDNDTCTGSVEFSLRAVMDHYMLFVENSLDRGIHTPSEVCLALYLVIEELRGYFDDDDDCDNNDLQVDTTELLLPTEEECFEVMKDSLERMSSIMPSSKSSGAKAKSRLPEDMQWKKLSMYLKSLVGTKVYNKWKRNRKEL